MATPFLLKFEAQNSCEKSSPILSAKTKPCHPFDQHHDFFQMFMGDWVPQLVFLITAWREVCLILRCHLTHFKIFGTLRWRIMRNLLLRLLPIYFTFFLVGIFNWSICWKKCLSLHGTYAISKVLRTWQLGSSGSFQQLPRRSLNQEVWEDVKIWNISVDVFLKLQSRN